MTTLKGCPGAIAVREAVPEYVNCLHCGEEVEIWTDEVQARCPKCKETTTREQGPSCIEWCTYAKECVGVEKYERLMSARQDSEQT